MNYLIALIFLLFATTSWSQEDVAIKAISELCTNWEKHLIEKNDPSYDKKTKDKRNQLLKVYGRAIFSKKSLIGIQELSRFQNNTKGPKIDTKFYSVSLSKEFIELEDIREKAKVFKQNNHRLKKINTKIFHLFNQSNSFQECFDLLKKEDEIIHNAKRLSSEINADSRIGLEIDNSKIFKITSKVAKRYSSKVTAVNIENLGTLLKIQKESVAVLVLHASEDGRLYDSNWNDIPTSLFNETGPNIKTLIIYSCHPEEVAKRYKLAQLGRDKKIKIILPSVHSSLKEMLGEAIPAPLLQIFIKKALKASVFSNDKVEVELKKDCSLVVNTDSFSHGVLGLFLNQKFIGLAKPGENKLDYDCEINKASNVFTLRNMNLLVRPVISANTKNWSLSVRDLTVEIFHTFKNGKYIGSKGSF